MIGSIVPAPLVALGSTLTSLAALTLAVVFGLAALAKLANRERAARDFGTLDVPGGVVAVLVVAVAELVTAMALIVAPRPGAVAALVLLVGFSAVVIRALGGDKPIRCACFGPLSDGPVSSKTLARNGVLLSVASGIAVTTGSGLPPIDPVAVMVLTLFGVIVAMIAQLALTGRRIGRLWSIELAGEGTATWGGGHSDGGDRDGGDVAVVSGDVLAGFESNHGGLEEEQR